MVPTYHGNENGYTTLLSLIPLNEKTYTSGFVTFVIKKWKEMNTSVCGYNSTPPWLGQFRTGTLNFMMYTADSTFQARSLEPLVSLWLFMVPSIDKLSIGDKKNYVSIFHHTWASIYKIMDLQCCKTWL